MYSLRSILRQYYILLLPLGLWVAIWVYLQIGRLTFDSDRIFYGLIVFRQRTGEYLLITSVLSFVGFLLGVSIIRRPLPLRQDATFAITLVLLAMSVPCSCVTGVRIFECGTTFTHVDRINIGQDVYQVAFINQECYSESSYTLYRCDAIGLICDRLQRIDTSHGAAYETLGNYQAASTAKLLIEPNSDQLSMRVGDEVIVSFSP